MAKNPNVIGRQTYAPSVQGGWRKAKGMQRKHKGKQHQPVEGSQGARELGQWKGQLKKKKRVVDRQDRGRLLNANTRNGGQYTVG